MLHAILRQAAADISAKEAMPPLLRHIHAICLSLDAAPFRLRRYARVAARALRRAPCCYSARAPLLQAEAEATGHYA